jgi:hypothetical protein
MDDIKSVHLNVPGVSESAMFEMENALNQIPGELEPNAQHDHPQAQMA